MWQRRGGHAVGSSPGPPAILFRGYHVDIDPTQRMLVYYLDLVLPRLGYSTWSWVEVPYLRGQGSSYHARIG